MTPKGVTKRILASGRITRSGKVRDDFRIVGDVEKNTADL
jgi:hypothetical protein